MDLKIVGEHVHHVEHCLIALESIPISRIRKIMSHPQALQQCSQFLSSLENCEVSAYTDTAMAVEKVLKDQDLLQAAIASEQAANLHGLAIIKRDVANQRENYTRFVVVSQNAETYDTRIACKTSLVFATRDERGALLMALNVLAEHGLNLTKLESRPRPHTPWEYLFYVDFEGNVLDERVKVALTQLATKTGFLKVLGSYPIKNAKVEDAPSLPSGTVEVVSCVAPSATTSQSVIKSLEKKSYKLASRLTRSEDTEIRVGNVVIGGSRPVVIAGPCSVESREQVMSVAKVVKDMGGEILRGGCFKPRTSPYDFQGMGYEGLDLLCEAGQRYGMPVVTEVMHPSDVKPVAEKADMLQIGARNMQNFSLLKEIGTIDRPVILKRGLMSTIDEWLSAAEYILAHGNQRVILCERGIRTFETATRSTLDLSAVPVVRERSHLPIIVDPSHASGTWQYIPALSEAAMAVGSHGIMVEVHPEPTKALSDGPQALKYDTFEKLMKRLEIYRR
jgi:chorismate mutase/prephenate dehydratase